MHITVASGKGGAGKTTLVASLAAIWKESCIAVDADVEAPNLHLFLPPELREEETIFLPVPVINAERCTLCGACRDMCTYRAIAKFATKVSIFPDMCHGCGGCFLVCPAQALDVGKRELGVLNAGTILSGKVRFLSGRTRIGEAMTPPLLRALHETLEHMQEELASDILMDAPPGVSCPAMSAASHADAILLVAEPTPFGFHDFKLAFSAFRQLKKPVLVVINRAGIPGNEEGDAAVRTFCHEQNLPLLGELPFERQAAEWYARGNLLVTLSDDWRKRFEALRDTLRAGEWSVHHA